MLGEIRLLEIDRQIKTEELALIDGDLAITTGQLEETAAQMGDLDREADALRPVVEARLVALYKMGTPGYTQLLLSSGDLLAIGRNYRLMGSLARRDRRQFDDLHQTVADLELSRSMLEASQGEVAALQNTARAACQSLVRTIASQTALVEEIDTRRDLTAQLAGELVVHEGVVIDQRAELGTAGVSPTGDPTVYFELRIDGRSVDPVEWLE